jgi:hypothetical protein
MRTFQIDHRTSNPGLHTLYVGYAVEEIRIIDEAILQLMSLSRTTAITAAGLLMNFLREEASSDAAWFDAAAIVKLGLEVEQPEAPRAAPINDDDIPF